MVIETRDSENQSGTNVNFVSSLKKSNTIGCSLDKLGESNEKGRPTLKKSVSFSHLNVREHSIALGDHPCCSKGPPVSISWEYNEYDSIDIEMFEMHRGQRRSREELVLSSRERRRILKKSAGMSKREILEAERRIAEEQGRSIEPHGMKKTTKILKNAGKSMSRIFMSGLAEYQL
uniref:Uncharacterized protein n=1 Tax=Ditylum brightwellii TaxID=49249 RepID=A0A7S4RLD2_9STRA